MNVAWESMSIKSYWGESGTGAFLIKIRAWVSGKHLKEILMENAVREHESKILFEMYRRISGHRPVCRGEHRR